MVFLKMVRRKLYKIEIFGPVACEVVETEAVLDLHTEHLHLHFEKGPFAPDRLFIELKGQYAVYGSRWHYGDQPETLKGTSRTLDEVDGAMELQDGILSKAGYALLDDSASYLYDAESGFRARSIQKWICISSVMGAII